MICKILIVLVIINYAQAQHLSHNQGFPPHQHSLGCVCSNFIFLNIHGELVSKHIFDTYLSRFQKQLLEP